MVFIDVFKNCASRSRLPLVCFLRNRQKTKDDPILCCCCCCWFVFNEMVFVDVFKTCASGSRLPLVCFLCNCQRAKTTQSLKHCQVQSPGYHPSMNCNNRSKLLSKTMWKSGSPLQMRQFRPRLLKRSPIWEEAVLLSQCYWFSCWILRCLPTYSGDG